MDIKCYIGIFALIIFILIILCSDFNIDNDNKPTDF